MEAKKGAFSCRKRLQLLRDRDHQFVTQLVDQYNDVLLKAARTHKISVDTAEELVQDTWSDFYSQIERFEGRSHIRTYLIGILYNKIRAHLRQSSKNIYTANIESEEFLFFNQDRAIYNRDPEKHIQALDRVKSVQWAFRQRAGPKTNNRHRIGGG